MHAPIIILGAGLSGLTLGYYLQKTNIDFIILEARDRTGGRIHTLGKEGASLEMGATWFGQKHRHLTALMEELQIESFPQHKKGISLFETFSFAPPQKFDMPEEEEETYRIKGGSDSIIHELAKRISKKYLFLNTPIKCIFFTNDQATLVTEKGDAFSCKKLVSTLPPRLLVETIRFEPAFPEPILTLCRQTHTWMGESIKFSLEYDTPFWRKAGYSGAAFSQAGISNEMYDHSNEAGTFHALKGFLNPGSARLTQEERKKQLLTQLTKYYGEAALQYRAYHEAVWSEEKYTFYPYDGFIQAHQNNGNPAFQEWYFNGKFRIAGSETAAYFPGYMDGAVCSAKEVFEQLITA